jgi:hypothetical protein
MYQSFLNGNITLSICALWDGEVDIYDPDVRAIELGIGIINRSKEDLRIDHLILRIRRNRFLFFLYEDIPVKGYDQLIAAGSRLDFVYDLKPILDLYGPQKSICFKVISGKMEVKSEPLSIKQIHSSIIALYARHF